MDNVEFVVDCRNVLGEGVVWNHQASRLHWVDIESKEFWTLDPDSGRTHTDKLPERMACFALRSQGGLLAGFASGFAFLDPATGQRTPVAEFEPALKHTRLNDGRTDRQGRFIAGGFDEVEGKFISSVVRLDTDRRVTTLFGEVACANGTCFSPDGRTMYFADSPARKIWAFDYDIVTGTPSNRRVLADLKDQPGQPDGSCVDADGFIWNAQWNGRRVVRFAPDGRIDRIISIPVLNPTCVAFGGGDLGTLYVTTARYLMKPEQIEGEPLSGGLFATVPGVKGLPETKFKG